MFSNKFFILRHGWANRYYWFAVIENVDPSTPPFEEMIKKGKFTFSKQSGTTPADMHGSTMAIDFYSQRFVNFLKKVGIRNFSVYKLKFVPEMSKIGNYYYLELKDELPAKRTFYTKILSHVNFYLKDWKGQDIFAIEGTKMIIVTEKLRKLIEKEKLKNVEFEEIKPA
ncbi:MAG: hypothetical protein HY361_05655 [Candidatus Aenigmarchaeota archaeon]|nr:hypothetical protein [Candidatus Aenigmarchaeota archaeon]